jgi:hypothetical protein
MVQVVRQELDIANGVLTVKIEHNDLRGGVRPVTLTCFVSRENGHISVSSDSIAPVVSVAYQPNWDDEAQLPEPELWAGNSRFSGYQHFPATAPTEAQPSRCVGLSFARCPFGPLYENHFTAVIAGKGPRVPEADFSKLNLPEFDHG